MISQRDIIDAARRLYYDQCEDKLESLVQVVMDYFKPPEDNKCFKCGCTDSDNWDNGFGPCVDVCVMIANGEEGFSHISKYVCNDHLIEIVDAFKALGFRSHHHGSTTLLEDDQCPGYTDWLTCPTPKGYGESDESE